jgi:uncharacterized protein YjbI with pentapeptide repeats
MRQKLIAVVVVLGVSGAFAIGMSASASADVVIGSCTIVSNPTSTVFTNCPGANLSGADLSNLDLSYAKLSGANLTGANLTNVNFFFSTLDYAVVTDATVTGASIGPDSMSHITSGGLVGTPAGVGELGCNGCWTLVNGFLLGPTANAAGVNAAGANFDFYTWNGIDLTNANFSNTSLRYTQLTNATLAGINLSGAGGFDTHFESSNLTGANLTGAGLYNSFFQGANLTNATLTNASLQQVFMDTNTTVTGVISGGITGFPTSLPAGWSVVNGYLIAPGVNLTAADLTTANLTNLNLTGANLTNATLTGANLSGTDLTNATLTGVTSGGIIGTPAALPTGWTLVDGYLLGPGIHLLTITADNKTIILGAPLPTLTYSVSGLVNNDPPSIVTGVVCTTAATNTSPAGAYPITCSGGSAPNYVLDFKPGALTIGYSVSIVAPPPNTVFKQGAKITVKFQLLTNNGQPIANTLAASLGCTVTATFNNTSAVCATYTASKKVFQATVTTSTGLTHGQSYPITIRVTVGTAVVATGTVNITAK